MAALSKTISEKKILRVGLVSPVDFQHPWKRIDFVNLLVYLQVFDTVFAPHRKSGKANPVLLAETLCEEISDGGVNVFSAEIRSDVCFSNGTPMTADHVAQSLTQNSYLADIVDVEVRGNRLYFHTTYSSSALALCLSNPESSVVLNEGSNFIGTGAYAVAADSTPKLMRLVRNTHFRSSVDIDEIEFHAYPRDSQGKATALIDAVNRGSVDFTNCFLREEVKQIESARTSFDQGLSTCLFYFNTERAPFDNPMVRRAVGFALDRSSLARLFYSNHLAYAASCIIPPAMDIIPDMFTHDMDKAKELLNQSGVDPAAREITLSTISGPRPYLPDPVRAATAVAEQLAPLGFRIKVDPTKDMDDYFCRTSSGEYDLMLSGWIPDTPSAFDFLDVLLSSKNIPGDDLTVMTSINLARWRSKEMDEALISYRTDPDSPMSRSVITRLMQQEVPVMATMFGPDIMVHSWRVEDVPKDFSDLPLFSSVRLSNR